jgi:hypothetical protein
MRPITIPNPTVSAAQKVLSEMVASGQIKPGQPMGIPRSFLLARHGERARQRLNVNIRNSPRLAKMTVRTRLEASKERLRRVLGH